MQIILSGRMRKKGRGETVEQLLGDTKYGRDFRMKANWMPL